VGGLLYHGEVIRRMQDVLVAHGRARDGEIHIPTLRDELGTTRKYLIPLLEFFDTRGVTVRRGDRRILKPGQD
jgi:selenocysteine-specific elongation factor